MNGILLLTGVVILACILAHRFTEKLPIPTLLVFIGLGMLFGENGLFRIRFNDYSLAETVCSVCLIFIMYYGGFGTNWRAARPVAVQSVLLSTLGVLLTAAIEGITKKKLNPKVEGYIHAGGMVVLMLFMVFILFKDVVQIIV